MLEEERMKMKIAYIANHGCGGNDDEGAIAHALEALGHEVVRLPERGFSIASAARCDLLLSHKWANNLPARVNRPWIFWYFDLVDWPDPTLRHRNETRMRWMRENVGRAALGFCTDGDWVDRFNPMSGGKLVWLMQGADERVVGRDEPTSGKRMPIVFTGIKRGGGRGRIDFVNWMESRFGDRFHHCERGIHRERLRGFLAHANVVVCPDSPVTDRYWSNRIYNAAGFGACVVHPHAKGLEDHYQHEREIICFPRGASAEDRANLESKLFYLLDPDNEPYRRSLGEAALRRTEAEHLYRHRLEVLLRIVRERLGGI